VLKVLTLIHIPTPALTLILTPLLKLAVVSNLTVPFVISNLRKVFTVKDV